MLAEDRTPRCCLPARPHVGEGEAARPARVGLRAQVAVVRLSVARAQVWQPGGPAAGAAASSLDARLAEAARGSSRKQSRSPRPYARAVRGCSADSRFTHRKETKTWNRYLKEPVKPLTQDEIGRRNYEAVLNDRSRTDATLRLCHYFAEATGRASDVAPSPNFSHDTVRGLLDRGFSEKQIREHIDLLMREMKEQGREPWQYPPSLGDYRKPVKATEEGA